MREHVFEKLAMLPFHKLNKQAIKAWPLIVSCPVCHQTVFDLIYSGREKRAHGQAPKASADLSIFPCFCPHRVNLLSQEGTFTSSSLMRCSRYLSLLLLN
jgi:hypothetical protein